ncbi:MAG: alpha/beta hydrolase family protein [Aliiglaciecola sp.]
MAISRFELGLGTRFGLTQASLTVFSSNTNRRHDISIYNATPKAKNTPMVVLLHGVYGSHWVWQSLGKADAVYKKQRAQGLSEFVLVMPSDGGAVEGTAYVPLTNGEDYERWLIEDVISAAKQVVEKVTDKSPVYLCGLSMGGYGVLRLGCKYANKIAAVSAHSSITRLEDLSHFTEVQKTLYPDFEGNEASILYWAKKHKTSLPPIRLDCGKSDILFNANLNLIRAFEEADIPHVFETFDGEHEWSYWQHHLGDSLRFFDRHFLENKNV